MNRTLKNIALALALAFTALTAKAQVEIPWQKINYDVNYKWGIIDVNIAKGDVTLQSDYSGFRGTLDGVSISWEGHIICVSDTLQASFSGAGTAFAERVGYQAGWYRRPSVSLYQSRDYDAAAPAIYRNIAGQGAYDASDDSMEAITVTSDMLGMYYLAHAIDFDALRPGEQVRVDISGGYSREAVITYRGRQPYSCSAGNFEVYECTFEYGYDGRMSGFPVECKIGVDSRIPLFLCADLPVGRVEMLYTR